MVAYDTVSRSKGFFDTHRGTFDKATLAGVVFGEEAESVFARHHTVHVREDWGLAFLHELVEFERIGVGVVSEPAVTPIFSVFSFGVSMDFHCPEAAGAPSVEVVVSKREGLPQEITAIFVIVSWLII